LAQAEGADRRRSVSSARSEAESREAGERTKQSGVPEIGKVQCCFHNDFFQYNPVGGDRIFMIGALKNHQVVAAEQQIENKYIMQFRIKTDTSQIFLTKTGFSMTKINSGKP